MKTTGNNNKPLFPEIYTAWSQNPNEANTTGIMQTLEKTLNNAITSYAKGDNGLKTRAYLIALDALKSYDPKTNVNLNTYVMNQLKSLNRFKRERENLIHIPENVYYNQQLLDTKTSEFIDEKGREPSDQELADRLGISLKQIGRARGFRQFTNSSKVIHDSGDDMSTSENTKDPFDDWKDYVYFDSDNTDKLIMERISGYNGHKIQSKGEVAKKLGISNAALSQRVSKLSKRLEEYNDAAK
jgi:DNA-directed RNA polymerase specialized sigma subunit